MTSSGAAGRRPDGGALLVVNADDYGLTEGVSRAILHAHRDGVVTSTSVLALAPGFATSVRWLDDAPELGTGAHLAAVGEDPPLLSAREVPTLVDRQGRLWSSWRVFLPRAAAGRIDPDDLRREFGAQIEAVLGAGVHVDHLDTHQNLHLWPMVADVVLDLGEAHDVRTIRVTRSIGPGPVGLTVRRLATRLEGELARRGWRWPEASTGLDEAGGLDLGAMVSAVERLAATGARSAELATHPGGASDPDRYRYRWSYRWEDEYAALRSATVKTAIAELGFRLGTFAELDRRSA
ncbi:MAG TPA: ChbG/HpnK family deacetylase [Acidimicrobiales bacterium]